MSKKNKDINFQQVKEAKWTNMFLMLKSYVESGNTYDQIGKDMKYDGRYVRSWIDNQRIVLSKPENINHPHRELLCSINFPWKSQKDLYFDHMIELISEYTKINNCNINDITNAISYKGVDIGFYIESQRYWYKRDPSKYLSNRSEAFEKLGIAWDINAYRWNKDFERYCRYTKKHGSVFLPESCIDEDGFELGKWAATQRAEIKKRINKTGYKDNALVNWDYRKKKLDDIGFIWDIKEYEWNAFIEEIAKVGFNPPDDHVIEKTGYNLRASIQWVRLRKKQGTLPPEKIKQMEDLGICWSPLKDRWENGFSHASDYYRINGHLYVLVRYVCKDGFHLGDWLAHQRKYKKEGKLSKDRINRLNSLSFDWNPKTQNQTSYMEQAVFYYFLQAYPNSINGCHDISGVTEIDVFVPELKLGIEYDGKGSHMAHRNDADFRKEKAIRQLGVDYLLVRIRENGANASTEVPTFYINKTNDVRNDTKAIVDIANQILSLTKSDKTISYHDGDVEKITKMYLSYYDYRWERGYLHLREFFLNNGHSNVPNYYVCSDGYSLGVWVSCQRSRYRGRKSSIPLNQDQIQKLLALDFVFEPKKDIKFLPFEVYYSATKCFLERDDRPTIFSCTEKVDGMSLRNWFNRMRCAVRGQRYTKQLSETDKQRFLELLEINNVNKEIAHRKRYEAYRNKS